jgi:hypothetical protein
MNWRCDVQHNDVQPDDTQHNSENWEPSITANSVGLSAVHA